LHPTENKAGKAEEEVRKALAGIIVLNYNAR